MATMDDTIYTTDDIFYVNQTYSSPIVSAVSKIATNQTLTTNLQFFLNASSAASNQTWGGIKRADIYTYGSVTSSDILQWLKIFTSGSAPEGVDTYPNSRLVIDELYTSWLTQGIGYYGDTTAQPLFLPAVEKEFDVEVGEIINWVYNNNSFSFYGFDTGPNLYYGTCRNAYFQGKDNKFYKIHACRWTGDDSLKSVYLRVDGSHILKSNGIDAYTDEVFDNLIIGSTSFSSTNIGSKSFIENGYIGYYWEDISTNPFGSTGSTTICKMSAVSSGPYGAEFYNSNGKITLSIVDRVSRFVSTGVTPSVAPTSSYFQAVAGMENNDTWQVFANISGLAGGITGLSYTLQKSTGGFTITNNDTNNSHQYEFWVLKT